MKQPFLQATLQATVDLLRQNLKTAHGAIVLCGLTIGLCYLPIWLGDLVLRAVQGSTGLILISGVLYLGLGQLWRHRQHLTTLSAGEEDRVLGHLLIVSGVLLFPFFRAELWSQAVIWLLILVGIVVSTWGSRFFTQYPLTTFLIPLSVYPRPGITARILWETLTPHYLLEQLMAWGGAIALRAIGQPAEASGILIALPTGSVQVNWGCNGFNMAFAMAVTGLLFGLFFKLDRIKTLSLILMGIMLALIFNVPRIMLVTLAAVYWGDKWFHFWHGSWGAQIFVGILFTAYYYLVMAIIDRSFKKLPV